MPSELNTSFTDTTPLSNHDFQSKIALTVVINVFQRINLTFGKKLAVFERPEKVLDKRKEYFFKSFRS